MSLKPSRLCIELLYVDVTVVSKATACENLIQGWSGEILECISHVVICNFLLPAVAVRRPVIACWNGIELAQLRIRVSRLIFAFSIN